jgi:lysozyme
MGEGASRVDRRLRWAVAVCAAVGLAVLSVMPSAAAATLRGIDVSHHNGKPDWGQVKAAGVRFAIAKATEGSTFIDDEYLANKQRAAAQQMPFTAYHFARPDNSAGDAVSEADHFVSVARLLPDNLVPVLDLEFTGGLGERKLKRWVKDWLNEVRAQLGVKPLIYTNPSFWRTSLGNTRWFADNGYRLWIAHWTSAAQPSVPASNWGGRGWALWQYDNCGSVAGIDGCVDLDRFKGTDISVLKIKNSG